ncbi:MAG TPA: MobF family relaxase, partial [Galbitalea sp.]
MSSAKIGRSSWRYYQNSVAAGACEYYLGRGEAPGRWFGRGLPELGLEQDGIVAEAELEAVFARALHPVTGAALGRAWRTDAVTGFDLTFSAPKSVSTLWALGGPTAGRQVLDAHRAAVMAALGYLDTHAGLSRRGTNGVEQVATGGLVAALFDHRTSRAGDPQLHTHALVPNKLRCVDGVWRTLDGHEIYHHKKAAGAVYQAALRAELHTRLGVVFEPVNAHGQAEIVGVPTDLMTAWSKRTAQIAAEAGPTIDEYEQNLGRDLTRDE